MKRWVTLTLVLLASAALIPFALIFKARTTLSPKPRVHLVQNMDNQLRYKSQQANPVFADGRAMRPPVAGAVAREVPALDVYAGEAPRIDDHFRLGKVDGEWANGFPIELTAGTLRRGRERYGIFCSPCHGLSGHGDGIVGVRADRLQEGTWVPPASLHDPNVRARPEGHLFNTVSNGIRTMAAYGSQIPVEDRWAIVAYVRALQRSQSATIDDVPFEERAQVRQGAP